MATMLGLTPQQKAALVVVSGLPAPPGVAGVIVQKYDRDAARPVGALVVADQEGGRTVRDGRPRRLPDTRPTPRGARAGRVPTAARPRVRGSRDNRLARCRPRSRAGVGRRGRSGR